MNDPLPRGLYVSCQAAAGSPLRQSDLIAVLARCAELGGAVGLRAEGLDDIAAVSAVASIPVIGLVKRGRSGVYITPTIDDVRAVGAAGADAVAVDATLRPRPDGSTVEEFLRSAVAASSIPVVADVDSLEAAVAAERCGVAYVATTLSGYTGESHPTGPDLDLVASIAAAVSVPVLAEGRYRTTEETRAAMTRGAHGVVIGGAITDPVAITRRFAESLATVR